MYYARLLSALCGLWQDNNHTYVALKIKKKILPSVSINKVISTKYIVESSWYLCMSRCGRNRTSERSKTNVKDFWYKNSEWVNIKIPRRCVTSEVSISSHKIIRKCRRTHWGRRGNRYMKYTWRCFCFLSYMLIHTGTFDRCHNRHSAVIARRLAESSCNRCSY